MPSGDQAGRPIGPYFEEASSLRSLPSAPIVKSLRSDVVKAIDLLSGDQTSDVFRASRSVTFLAGPAPSAAMTWISSRPLWSEMKAIDLPSGEYSDVLVAGRAVGELAELALLVGRRGEDLAVDGEGRSACRRGRGHSRRRSS